MKIDLVKDLARKEISKKLEYTQTNGAGMSKDTAARQIIQNFEDAKIRFVNKPAVYHVYLKNPETPEGLADIAERYLDGKIDQKEAKVEIEEMKQVYETIFSQEYGLFL
jgi:hypothetical protein